ncbi:hypothetical protein [Streptomyces dangxiongensis]|uniref:hypothetical protein n=1 Tax=Streptomyces dangxiongensis TaxID=1442032 RepID=UPI001969C9A6|nr:hypothetical protein [Streptomyces dangxiongensis]
MTTRFDNDPESAPDDPLTVILRPPADYLGPPPGRYEAIRRTAGRRRLLRAAVGAALTCAAALVALPLHLSGPSGPAMPTVPLAPPPPATAPGPTPPPGPTAPASDSATPSPRKSTGAGAPPSPTATPGTRTTARPGPDRSAPPREQIPAYPTPEGTSRR